MKDSNRIYKVKDIQCDLSLEWNIDISYKHALRGGGKHIVLNMLNGSHDDSFSQLPYYCHNLKLANEGSITNIRTDEQGRFEMLFVRFGFAIRSFIRYLRPLIIIDSAHPKGSYKRTNLVAVRMDGNNQILPIAMSVTQDETGVSWTWFISRLKDCIGEVPNLCTISDRHPVIVLACKMVFNNSFHGYCNRHLMINCKFKGKNIKGIFWKTCKAYTTHEFDSLLVVLHGYRPDGVQKLEIDGFDKWSRAYCPTNGNNYMTSNSVESVNSLSRQKQMSNKTHMTQEQFTREALLDKERARNGRIYLDWYDLEAQEPKTPRK
nr:transposase, MuDR, MULE transposase domain protein [Tanacetum cinerariifolium]